MDAETQLYASRSLAGGSQSFAAAAKLFGAEMRRDATALYAWCRHCDDVVDGQILGRGRVDDGAAPADRLEGLEKATRDALSDGPVEHPAFQALREVVRRHEIPHAFPLAHLDGFQMDIEGRRYRTLDELLSYCYGVAGVVGIMMAYVMGVRDARTLDRACDLGLAFQLTNIARDVVEDGTAGRVYLPLDWLVEADVRPHQLTSREQRPALARVAARLVAAAEPYYESAQTGLAALPWRAAWTIGTAKGVYRAIGRKVVAEGAKAWDDRIYTSGSEKVAFVAAGALAALSSRIGSPPERSSTLWTRPREILSRTA